MLPYLMKILVIGENDVGKSTFLSKVAEKIDTCVNNSSMILSFYLKKSTIDNSMIRFQLWEVKNKHSSSIYLGSLGIIFIFDLTRIETLRDIMNGINIFHSENCGKGIPVVILGNKVDLYNKIIDDSIKQSITNEIILFINYLKDFTVNFLYKNISILNQQDFEELFLFLGHGFYNIIKLKSS